MKWAPGATEGTVVAGGNGSGSATNQLKAPYGIDVDSSGNMYVTDTNNHRIMKWAPDATEGTVVAGGNGRGSALNQFDLPGGAALDNSGNIYVADYENHRVIELTLATALSGVSITSAEEINQFDFPGDVALDNSDNIYAADQQNNRIQKITINPEITIAAGSTTGTVTFTGIDDSIDEAGETIIVTPSTSTN